MRRASVVLFIVFALSACGGGGGGMTPSASTQPGPAGSGGGPLVLLPPAHYSVVDLGAYVSPAAINAHGEVVGTIQSASNPIGPGGTPFRYQNGTLTKLLLPAQATSGNATDVNDEGVITGTDGSALQWQPDGSVVNMGALPNSSVSFVAISDTGQMLGLSPENTGVAGCGGLLTQFSTSASPQDVGPLALGVAINNNGLAVFGDYSQQGPGCDGTVSPALYPGFGSVAVPPDFTLNSRDSAVTDINGSGAVIGFGPTTTAQGTGPLATYYSQGSHAMEIDPPSGYDTIEGNGLNDAGWIVGTLQNQATHVTPHAFLWVNNAATIDLNTLMPANCTFTLNTATDVNDSGYIVGMGTVNGVPHGFLLIPQQ